MCTYDHVTRVTFAPTRSDSHSSHCRILTGAGSSSEQMLSPDSLPLFLVWSDTAVFSCVASLDTPATSCLQTCAGLLTGPLYVTLYFFPFTCQIVCYFRCCVDLTLAPLLCRSGVVTFPCLPNSPRPDLVIRACAQAIGLSVVSTIPSKIAFPHRRLTFQLL